MSKFPNASEETAAAQRDEALGERPQDRFVGRRKFQFCHECGSDFGMHGVCREALAMMYHSIRHICWYKEIDNDEYLFYVCEICNRNRAIPDSFIELTMYDAMNWVDRDPVTPDYTALAAEEPMSQIKDSRDSAGLEG